MLRIAVTGGIGSGKTAVTDHLMQLGYTVIDTDQISRGTTAAGGTAIPLIWEKFGDDYILPDGSLDRKKMRETVFRDPERKALLESCTMPPIRKEVAHQLAAAEDRGEPVVFVAIPLLFETGMEKEYDESWAVIADLDIRRKRIRQRDHLTDEMISRIFASQADDEERKAKATRLIDNSGTLEELYRSVDRILSEVLLTEN